MSHQELPACLACGHSVVPWPNPARPVADGEPLAGKFACATPWCDHFGLVVRLGSPAQESARRVA